MQPRRVALHAVPRMIVTGLIAAVVAGCPSTTQQSSTDGVRPPPPPRHDVTELDRITWEPSDLDPPEGEIVLAITPWRDGFVAAGTTYDFEALDPAEPDLENLVRAVFWQSHDGLRWSRIPDADAHRGAFIHTLLPLADRILAFGTLGVCLPHGCSGLPPNGGTGVWESTDGATWTRLPDGGLENGAVVSVIVADDVLVAAGYVADVEGKPDVDDYSEPTDAAVWVSEDGRTWTRAAMDPGPDRAGLLATDGTNLILLCPSLESVTAWRSSDNGSTWTQAGNPAISTIDGAGTLDGRLVVAENDVRDVRVTPLAIDGSSADDPPIDLPGIQVTSIGSLGSGLLLSGHRVVEVEEDMTEAGPPILMVSADGRTWEERLAPDGWGDAAPWTVAVGPSAVVVRVNTFYPGADNEPIAPIWRGVLAASD